MIFQWWLLRLPVVLILPTFFLDIEFFLLFISFLFIHINSGFKSIVSDYLHNKKLLLFIIILIRVSNFEFLRYLLEFLF